MYDSTIAFKAHKQLRRFPGRISPHFSKPTTAFIGDALFGIQASGEVKLASWVKLLNCRAKPKKVEDRLSRHLSLEGMDRKLQRIVMEDSRGKVHDDTLIVIDPTDICKAGARKMEYLYTVRDGSRSRSDADPELVNGYTGCMAIACNPRSRRIVPLHFSLWSTIAPDYRSENDELNRILGLIRESMSIADAARDFGVDWRCVKDAEKEYLAEKYKVVSLEGVEAITIDEKMDHVRRREMAKLDDQAKRAIKGHRFVFMRNEENLDSHGQRILERMRESNMQLGPGSAIPEMIQMAKTVERHLSGILGYWDFNHASSGSAEGFNTKIRLLIKQSYGIRDFKYLRLKIHDLPSRRIKTHI